MRIEHFKDGRCEKYRKWRNAAEVTKVLHKLDEEEPDQPADQRGREEDGAEGPQLDPEHVAGQQQRRESESESLAVHTDVDEGVERDRACVGMKPVETRADRAARNK